MEYRIETLYGTNWEATVGEPNRFSTEEEALVAIQSLRDLGGEWADAEYRAVEFIDGRIAMIEVKKAISGTQLYRDICQYAGIPIPTDRVGPGETVVREGYGCPYALGQALRDKLGNDNALIQVFRRMEGHMEVGTVWVAWAENGRSAAVYRVR